MRKNIRIRHDGFTLVEAIMAIVITGIVATVVAVFIRAPVEGYVDAVARADMTDAADAALRRIARDVRTALPNSLRSKVSSGSGVGTWCFEFLPTVGGGRYRVAQRDVATGDILDFSANDASFDVLASRNLPPAAGYAAQHHVVIYNLGIPGADAFNAANKNRAAISTASGASPITLSAANQFPFPSPGNRFHVIPDYSVVYTCTNAQLLRSTQGIAASVVASCPTGGAVVAGNVDCANSGFMYTPVVSQRAGLLTLTLTLTQAAAKGTESIRLFQEVHVDNTP